MKDFFEFSRHGTGYRQETLAGVTTFLAIVLMASRTTSASG